MRLRCSDICVVDVYAPLLPAAIAIAAVVGSQSARDTTASYSATLHILSYCLYLIGAQLDAMRPPTCGAWHTACDVCRPRELASAPRRLVTMRPLSTDTVWTRRSMEGCATLGCHHDLLSRRRGFPAASVQMLQCHSHAMYGCAGCKLPPKSSRKRVRTIAWSHEDEELSASVSNQRRVHIRLHDV